MANINKFYKGSVESFKEWLVALSTDQSKAGLKKYEDIKNSIVFISENFDKEPESLENFTGAIYAHGSIIAEKTLLADDYVKINTVGNTKHIGLKTVSLVDASSGEMDGLALASDIANSINSVSSKSESQSELIGLDGSTGINWESIFEEGTTIVDAIKETAVWQDKHDDIWHEPVH